MEEYRRRGDARGHRPSGPPAGSTRPGTSRRLFVARPAAVAPPEGPAPTAGPPAPPANPAPVDATSSPEVTRATERAGSDPSTGLTVGAVVPRGAVVGVDDSDLVHGLLPAVVDARPSMVGTASLDAVIALTSAPAVRAGELTVRMFGGELRASTRSFTGPASRNALTATGCDVVFIGGRVTGTEVWVPTDAAPGRSALLRDACRAYLVLASTDVTPPAPDGWTKIADLAQFAGILEVAPPEPPSRSAAA